VRKNVRFYQSILDAERDGLRPCPRCFPFLIAGDDTLTDRVRKVCRYIETHACESLKLADLAKNSGLSRLRLFELRLRARGCAIGNDAESISPAWTWCQNLPCYDYRLSCGSDHDWRHGSGVCFVQFGDSTDELLTALKREYPKANHEPMIEPPHPEFQRWLTALTNHLAGKQPHLDLPLDIRSTAFQMRVWNYFQAVPYSDVKSYGEVAAGIGESKALRAFANACARNTVAVVIPCHRLIRGAVPCGAQANHLPQHELLGFPRFFDLNFF
jgi:AraC family transcriptional regulator, regulatory protein of adaptative response / methylated-DNA-[protein]-cysteine methyltransferase